VEAKASAAPVNRDQDSTSGGQGNSVADEFARFSSRHVDLFLVVVHAALRVDLPESSGASTEFRTHPPPSCEHHSTVNMHLSRCVPTT
jgi:hypothetical protein